MITGRGGRRISHRVPGTLQILICPRFSRISIFQVGHRVETLRNYRCGVELWYLTVISGHHQQTLNSTEGWRFNWCNGFDEIWSVFWRNNQLFYLVNVNIIWIIRTRPTPLPSHLPLTWAVRVSDVGDEALSATEEREAGQQSGNLRHNYCGKCSAVSQTW